MEQKGGRVNKDLKKKGGGGKLGQGLGALKWVGGWNPLRTMMDDPLPVVSLLDKFCGLNMKN